MSLIPTAPQALSWMLRTLSLGAVTRTLQGRKQRGKEHARGFTAREPVPSLCSLLGLRTLALASSPSLLWILPRIRLF